MELLPVLFSNAEIATALYKVGLSLERIAGDKQSRDEYVRMVLEKAERDGSLRTVLDAFARERPGVEELQAIATEVETAERVPDLRETANDLVDILHSEQVPDEILMQAFGVAAATLAQYSVNRRKTPDVANAVVMKLASNLLRSPLIKFAQLVKLSLDEQEKTGAVERLAVWITNTLPRLGITEKQKQDLDAEIAAEWKRRAEQRLHLLVSVRSVSVGADAEYAVDAWRTWVDPLTGKAQRWLRLPGGACKRSAIGNQIVSAVHLAGDDLFDTSATPTLELFLPLDLLTIDPDRWDLGDEDLPEMLGSRFSLLLRSWERSYSEGHQYRPIRADWRRLWDCRRHGESTALRLDKTPVNHAAYRHGTRLEKISCVALTFPPDASTVRLMVMSGTPIALWIRCDLPAHRHDIETFFDEIVAGHCEDFRPTIVEARLRALAGAEMMHFGHHLNLLWDDRDRQPPDSIQKPMMME